MLTLYHEERFHLFCAGQTLGHAAVNQFDHGYEKLHGGKLQDFIDKSTTFTDALADIRACRLNANQNCGHETSGDIDQVPAQTSDSTKASDTSSESCDSKSTSTSSACSQSDSNNNDKSNNHLYSGSNHSIFIEGHRLMHEAWYDGDPEGYSSEEDEDCCNECSDSDDATQ